MITLVSGNCNASGSLVSLSFAKTTSWVDPVLNTDPTISVSLSGGPTRTSIIDWSISGILNDNLILNGVIPTGKIYTNETALVSMVSSGISDSGVYLSGFTNSGLINNSQIEYLYPTSGYPCAWGYFPPTGMPHMPTPNIVWDWADWGDGHKKYVPMLHVLLSNPNRSSEKWDSSWSDRPTSTLQESIDAAAHRLADQLEYLQNYNLIPDGPGYVGIWIQPGDTLPLFNNPGDNLNPGPTDRASHLYSTSGQLSHAAYSLGVSGIAGRLRSIIEERNLRCWPGELIHDIEEKPFPWSACGGNTNGNGIGNWPYQKDHNGHNTVVLIGPQPSGDDSPLGGLSNDINYDNVPDLLKTVEDGMVFDDILDLIGDPFNSNSAFRNANNITWSRKYRAIGHVVHNYAIYQIWNLTFYTYFPGIKISNYDSVIADHNDYPYYGRGAQAAHVNDNRQSNYLDPSSIIAYYYDRQSPLLYPPADLLQTEGDTTTDFDGFTGTGYSDAHRGLMDRNIDACLNASVLNTSLDLIPHTQMPDIGPFPESENGTSYPSHVEDTLYMYNKFKEIGVPRFVAYSWNPWRNNTEPDFALFMSLFDEAFVEEDGGGGGGDPLAITSISPNTGLPNTSVEITITGTGFEENIQVIFSGNDIVVDSVNVVSDTTIVASIRILENAQPNFRHITLLTTENTLYVKRNIFQVMSISLRNYTKGELRTKLYDREPDTQGLTLLMDGQWMNSLGEIVEIQDTVVAYEQIRGSGDNAAESRYPPTSNNGFYVFKGGGLTVNKSIDHRHGA